MVRRWFGCGCMCFGFIPLTVFLDRGFTEFAGNEVVSASRWRIVP